MLCFDLKKTKKYITPINILENWTFQRIAKFIMVDSYGMDFMKVNVISVKVDEMYNILKSASHTLF